MLNKLQLFQRWIPQRRVLGKQADDDDEYEDPDIDLEDFDTSAFDQWKAAEAGGDKLNTENASPGQPKQDEEEKERVQRAREALARERMAAEQAEFMAEEIFDDEDDEEEEEDDSWMDDDEDDEDEIEL